MVPIPTTIRFLCHAQVGAAHENALPHGRRWGGGVGVAPEWEKEGELW